LNDHRSHGRGKNHPFPLKEFVDHIAGRLYSLGLTSRETHPKTSLTAVSFHWDRNGVAGQVPASATRTPPPGEPAR
jgi:hypothetical protein